MACCDVVVLQSDAEAAVRSSEEELARARHAISDLQTTVALLHTRLEGTQALAERGVEGLKGKLREVITALESPNMEQLHAMMLQMQQQQGGAGSGVAALAAGPAGGGGGGGMLVPGGGGAGGARGLQPRAADSVFSHADLTNMALG